MKRPPGEVGRAGGVAGPGRHRVTQPIANRMAALRREGLTFQQIGQRVGCSARTARRWVGHVVARIEVPRTEPVTEPDPKKLRVNLAKVYAKALMEGWDKWPSASFIAEGNRQFEERLEKADPQTLRLLARDGRIQTQFFLEVVGPIYSDFTTYRHAHEIVQRTSFTNKPFFWKPPHEREDLGFWKPPNESD